jgi:hypothetical protein
LPPPLQSVWQLVQRVVVQAGPHWPTGGYVMWQVLQAMPACSPLVMSKQMWLA